MRPLGPPPLRAYVAGSSRRSPRAPYIIEPLYDRPPHYDDGRAYPEDDDDDDAYMPVPPRREVGPRWGAGWAGSSACEWVAKRLRRMGHMGPLCGVTRGPRGV